MREILIKHILTMKETFEDIELYLICLISSIWINGSNDIFA